MEQMPPSLTWEKGDQRRTVSRTTRLRCATESGGECCHFRGMQPSTGTSIYVMLWSETIGSLTSSTTPTVALVTLASISRGSVLLSCFDVSE
jgi:hypothetical protein